MKKESTWQYMLLTWYCPAEYILQAGANASFSPFFTSSQQEFLLIISPVLFKPQETMSSSFFLSTSALKWIVL